MNERWTIVTLVIATKKNLVSREIAILGGGVLERERKFLVRRGLVVVSYLVRKFFSRSQWTDLLRKSRSFSRSWRKTDRFRRQMKHRQRFNSGLIREILPAKSTVCSALLNFVSDRKVGITSLSVSPRAKHARICVNSAGKTLFAWLKVLSWQSTNMNIMCKPLIRFERAIFSNISVGRQTKIFFISQFSSDLKNSTCKLHLRI